jgi:hypothetical protein
MSLNFEGKNQQHKIPTRFAELQQIQKQKKSELREILLTEYAHLLPEELWDMILIMIFSKDQIVAYFAFKRKDSFYNNDHYMFEGTEKDWLLGIERMRIHVNHYDVRDDVPIDTYCGGICRNLASGVQSCPDEFGNKCTCRWEHKVFNNPDEFIHYRQHTNAHVHHRMILGKNGVLWDLS